MNSNPRFHLANLLIKDQSKHFRGRQSFKDPHRVFGKQISNCSGILKQQKEQPQKIHSKSIVPDIKQTKQSVDSRLKELVQKKNMIQSVNMQNVPQYQQDIINFLLKKQQSNQLNGSIMSLQKQVNQKNRSTLVDWLVDAHYKFKLLPQTLFKTIKIIDLYLQKNQITKAKLQLVGVTALFIACKYQQIYPPQPKSFVSLAQRIYTFSQIVDLQGKILKQFDFNLTFSTSLVFLQKLIIQYNLNQKQANMCRYLLQLTLTQIKFYDYPSQILAFSAVFLMTHLLKKSISFNFQSLNTNQPQVKVAAKQLCISLQNIQKSNFQNTRKKYASSTFNQVSKIIIQPQSTI